MTDQSESSIQASSVIRWGTAFQPRISKLVWLVSERMLSSRTFIHSDPRTSQTAHTLITGKLPKRVNLVQYKRAASPGIKVEHRVSSLCWSWRFQWLCSLSHTICLHLLYPLNTPCVPSAHVPLCVSLRVYVSAFVCNFIYPSTTLYKMFSYSCTQVCRQLH